MKQGLAAVCLIVTVTLLTACVGEGYQIPVSERPQPKPLASQRYIVKQGDTLFAIAWRYGLDFKGLAKANNIVSPYRIMPGQLVRLTDRSSVTRKERLAQAPRAESRSVSGSRKQADKAVRKTENRTKAPASKVKTARSEDKGRFDKGKIDWQWPVSGRLLKSFSVNSSNIHKGIDLGGSIGDAIRSAAKGQVVYSGNGLSGYGNLVIVKHNQMYLSAYAHNRRLLVKEGQWVEAGEKIAELGKSGADRAKLHFQIRRDGKPVNPLKLLPPKG